jgi:hypothetical protein
MVRSSNTTLFAENEAPRQVYAVYELSSDAFTGRIAMVMGAKNMTMTEVQHAHRIGECSPAKLGSAGQF